MRRSSHDPPRATTYAGVASVLVAWLASANGVSAPPDSPAPQARPRLRDPGSRRRRPGADRAAARRGWPRRRRHARRSAIHSRSLTRARASRAAAAAHRAIVAAPASRRSHRCNWSASPSSETAGATVRTAMITADSDELFMLIVGDVARRPLSRHRSSEAGADGTAARRARCASARDEPIRCSRREHVGAV